MTRSYKEAVAKKGSNDVCYKLSVLFLRTCSYLCLLCYFVV